MGTGPAVGTTHEGADVVTVTWTRLGADGPRLVRASGWLYERVAAARDRRPPGGLVHAALDVDTLDVDAHPARTRVEMTPVWGQPPAQRGVVAEGPVGAAWLGVSRFFRYEVRRWAGAPPPSPADRGPGTRPAPTHVLPLAPSALHVAGQVVPAHARPRNGHTGHTCTRPVESAGG